MNGKELKRAAWLLGDDDMVRAVNSLKAVASYLNGLNCTLEAYAPDGTTERDALTIEACAHCGLTNAYRAILEALETIVAKHQAATEIIERAAAAE